MTVSVVRIGNSHGIRIPQIAIKKLGIKDKVEMDITDEGIMLKPINENPRAGWDLAFSQMHKNGDDRLDDNIDSEDFEWEWK